MLYCTACPNGKGQSTLETFPQKDELVRISNVAERIEREFRQEAEGLGLNEWKVHRKQSKQIKRQ